MRETIKHMLETMLSLYGEDIFGQARLKPIMNELFYDADYKKPRNLLGIALGEMNAFMRLKSLSGGEFMAVDTLITEMHEDFDITKETAKSLMQAIGEVASASVLRVDSNRTPIIGLTREGDLSAANSSEIVFGKYIWNVLKVENGRMLVITQDAIAERDWGRTASWENCDIRYFLNNQLIGTFSSEERAQILQCTSGDSLILLDAGEAAAFFTDDITRKTKNNSEWWLRPASINLGYVSGEGKILKATMGDMRKQKGIRPAMWLYNAVESE